MKHFLMVCFVPMTLAAQNMQQLTEQLGKTVLYGDLALSPDATHIAWVQSTAATTSRRTHIREISGDAPAKLVDIPITGDRTDFDPAWSPDSKTLAFFSSDGERGQRQLWTVKADGSDPKKLTSLNGYAARLRWSHDGKQHCVPLHRRCGRRRSIDGRACDNGRDRHCHSQSADRCSGHYERPVAQVSPPDLHIYDYDWSPTTKYLLQQRRPVPETTIGGLHRFTQSTHAKGNATSIYKPWFQIAVPRWSPDGKSIAFIQGLMSDEGFHGGDFSP